MGLKIRILLAAAVLGVATFDSHITTQSAAFAQAPQPVRNLKQGRWVGKFTPTTSDAALGVVFDVFLAQPNDVREFPRLEALLRLSLGGPLGHERDSTHYEAINYDFTTGALTFDEASSNLIVTAKVVEDKKILGTITNALTGVSGPLELAFADAIVGGGEPCEPDEPCDPPDDPMTRIPTEGFLTSLAGVYEGQCDGAKARLEVMTARLPDTEPVASDFLKESIIQARLGLGNTGQCGPGDGNCVVRSWETGQFEFFSSRLTLVSEQSSDVCHYGRQGQLKCEVKVGESKKMCALVPTGRLVSNVTPRKNVLKLPVTASEREPLPPAGAVLEPLRAKLEGTFSGYVLHEKNGRYQPLRFTSTATISTDNPHNEPNVYVSGTLRLHLGGGYQSPFVGFRVDRRTFFPSKGMTLRSETSDLMLVVDSWRSGHLAGWAYSQSFGRIGPFEMRRSEDKPNFPNGAGLQPDVVGVFAGEKPPRGHAWNFDIKVSPAGAGTTGLLPLNGSAQINAPGLPFPRFAIRQGSFDLFSGQVSLLTKESETSERLVSGGFENANTLSLWVPSSGSWGTQMSGPRATKHTRQ